MRIYFVKTNLSNKNENFCALVYNNRYTNRLFTMWIVFIYHPLFINNILLSILILSFHSENFKEKDFCTNASRVNINFQDLYFKLHIYVNSHYQIIKCLILKKEGILIRGFDDCSIRIVTHKFHLPLKSFTSLMHKDISFFQTIIRSLLDSKVIELEDLF